jgi:hypothetical protein
MNVKLYIMLMLGLTIACTSPALAKKDKPLPPGLQKKLERGEALPPGWQKKLAKGEVLDRAVYARSHELVPVNNKGVVTIQVEGRVLRLYKATREIVDILK